jgi:ankyrin repeat protein
MGDLTPKLNDQGAVKKKRAVAPGFVVDKRDSLGVTLLMEAVKQGLLEKTVQCIEEGSDVNARDNAGWDPLMHAVHAEHPELAALLVFHGADVTHATPGGETALMQACRCQLHEAIEQIVTKGAPLDVQEKKFGQTALMTAIEHGDAYAACRLAGAGADTDTITDLKGLTAEKMARQKFSGRDLDAFLNLAAAERDRRAAEARRRIENDVAAATVLRQDVAVLKPLSFRLKPR